MAARPRDELTGAADYRTQAHGILPLLRYIVAIKQGPPGDPH